MVLAKCFFGILHMQRTGHLLLTTQVEYYKIKLQLLTPGIN